MHLRPDRPVKRRLGAVTTSVILTQPSGLALRL